MPRSIETQNWGFRRATLPKKVFTLVFSCAALLALSSCKSKTKTPGPSVILITVDTLRADHLRCYGYQSIDTPATDALARDGVMFTRAIAQVPLTAPSHAAILTGTYPSWNGLRDWSDHGIHTDVPTLAEIFKRHGYTTAAFVSAFVLDSMWGLDRGFDLYDDWFKTEGYRTMRQGNLERRADETVDHALAWLKSAPAQPIFLWLHLYDPHAPYRPPEPFQTRYRDRPYDGEVAFTDQQIGRFFDYLKTQDLYAPSLIVLTSDHGEGLGEHQEQEHGFFIYNATVRVPLIIKFPSSYVPTQRSVSQVVNSVDIAPTLVRASGIPDLDARTFQGQSLLSLVEKDSPRPSRQGFSESLYPRNFLGTHVLFGVQTDRYHYIQAPQEELYDLTRDPGEQRNVIRDNPSTAQALRQTVEEVRARYRRSTAAGQNPSLDPETVEKLRSLGYVSLSSAKPPAEDDPTAADPKDRIRAYNQILRATALAESGQLREANRLLAALAAQYPQAFLLPFLEGENCRAMREARRAITYYRRALELNPTFDQAALGLGRAAYDAEDNSEAAKAFQLGLQLNPQDFLARLALARVYWRLKQLDDAAREQRVVLESHPQFAQAQADYGVTLAQMKRFDEAVPAIQRGIDLGYREAMVYNFLGNAYAGLGRTDDALHAFNQAVALDSKYPTSYVNLALLYDHLGQPAKARENFQKACRLNAELCRQLGISLR
ncbi:MAG: sulfatase-like hydrolase/transferase [Acidobacteriia bacterium]|nr:sulfatase-like hydrolase/transferase [Terriglobia bacterium]